MKKSLINALFFSFFLFFLIGCGSNKELEDYKTDMETFYNDISTYNDIINSINIESESAVEELLSALDTIEERIVWMASLSVPKKFSSIESIAADVQQNMTTAVSLYHQAYENNPFDKEAAEIAKEYYYSANEGIAHILSILHGKTVDNNETTSEFIENNVETIPETYNTKSDDINVE